MRFKSSVRGSAGSQCVFPPNQNRASSELAAAVKFAHASCRCEPRAAASLCCSVPLSVHSPKPLKSATNERKVR